MSAPAPFAREIARSYARAEPMQRYAYRAWLGSGCEVDVSGAASLADAEQIVAPKSAHKCFFSILEVDTFERQAKLTHYQVKRSSKRFVTRPALDGGYPVKEGQLYAERLFSQRVTAFEPVAPWQWSQDDPTGFKHGRLSANSPLLDGLA